METVKEKQSRTPVKGRKDRFYSVKTKVGERSQYKTELNRVSCRGDWNFKGRMKEWGEGTQESLSRVREVENYKKRVEIGQYD